MHGEKSAKKNYMLKPLRFMTDGFYLYTLNKHCQAPDGVHCFIFSFVTWSLLPLGYIFEGHINERCLSCKERLKDTDRGTSKPPDWQTDRLTSHLLRICLNYTTLPTERDGNERRSSITWRSSELRMMEEIWKNKKCCGVEKNNIEFSSYSSIKRSIAHQLSFSFSSFSFCVRVALFIPLFRV